MKEKIEDDESDRRSFLRKLAAGVGVGVAGLLLQQELIKPASAQPTAGDVAFSDGVGWIYDTTHKFFWDNTNKRLGIGTTSPARALHIQGRNAVFRMDRDVDGTSFTLVRTALSDFNTIWKSFYVGVLASGVNNGSFYIGDVGNAVSGPCAYRLFIDNVGKVGIGTTTPATKLEVDASSAVASRFWTTAGYTAVQFTGDGGTTLGGITTYASKIVLGRAPGVGGVYYDIVFDATNLRCGIGTSAPTQKLTVAGNLDQPVANSGLVKAGAEVSSAGSLLKGFNNLPGGTGPTVIKLATGQYEVDFGVNISARYYSATLYSSGMIYVQPRFGNVNAVYVATDNTAGALTDRQFYLLIY